MKWTADKGDPRFEQLSSLALIQIFYRSSERLHDAKSSGYSKSFGYWVRDRARIFSTGRKAIHHRHQHAALEFAALISIPVQNWSDFNLGPNKDGFRYTMDAQPV